MIHRILLLVSAIAVFSQSGALAENWTEFRGPSAQGHSSARGLPLHWDANKNVRWKVDIAGNGWSSPIVNEGRIYLTTAVPREDGEPRDQSLRTLCLDADTGETVWDVEVFDQKHDSSYSIHGKNSFATPTPITDGEYLYVHFGPEGTACLTLDGKIVWRSRELVYDPRHGSGSSPVLVNDVLVMSCDGIDVQFIIALDRAKGDVRWKRDRPEMDVEKRFAFCTPLVIEVEGQKQIVSPMAHAVVAYDPADGREIWTVRYSGYSVVPRPVFGNGLLFVGTSFDRAKLLAIRPDGEGDVTDTHVAWQSDRRIPHSASVLLVDENLYFVSDKGVASCVDAESGEFHWSERLGGNYSASPLFADGRIYFLSEEGETTVIAPTTKFAELARNPLDARTLASFAVVDSSLLIRTEKQLFRIDGP